MDISTKNKIFEILKIILQTKLSDIHILEDEPLYIRDGNGDLKVMEDYVISKDDIWGFLNSFLPDYKIELLLGGSEIDAAYQLEGSYLRINAFLDRKGMRLAIRRISSECPGFDVIGLNENVKKYLMKDRGLILVTGPTGSGKSTTLASMLEYINENRNIHILTLEDPIEYVFKNKKSLVTQREIGRNSKSFQDAMRYALRQDPDVIMVGEMRDVESISSVLTLVETGHLVLSTLHTIDASQTISRIIDVFPPHKQDQVAGQLSLSLELVICQKLLPLKGGAGRVAAREIMVNTTAIANNIRERKIHQLNPIIETGFKYGMKTMDHCLAELYVKGLVDLNAVLPKVRNLESFKILASSIKENENTFKPVD